MSEFKVGDTVIALANTGDTEYDVRVGDLGKVVEIFDLDLPFPIDVEWEKDLEFAFPMKVTEIEKVEVYDIQYNKTEARTDG